MPQSTLKKGQDPDPDPSIMPSGLLVVDPDPTYQVNPDQYPKYKLFQNRIRP